MTVAVIPCYNEKNTLADVVTEVSDYVDAIVVIDDGSTDGSLERLSPNPGLVIIRNEMNRGKGYSLKKGIEASLELGADKIITLDADKQHPPHLIPEFVKALETGDFVIGSRSKTPGIMPFHRILSNFLTSKMLSFKTGLNIEDSQCGFRAVTREHADLFNSSETGFAFETDVLIRAGIKKLTVRNVKIPTIYGDTASKMRNLETIRDFLRLLFR